MNETVMRVVWWIEMKGTELDKLKMFLHHYCLNNNLHFPKKVYLRILFNIIIF